MDEVLRKEIKKQLENREEKILSEFATKSSNGDRRIPIEDDDIRPSFSRDTDRIIHSGGYTRYIDKTQVFYYCENDQITHRVLHVQLVSKIARHIGRCLRLNEDLIEAIALGHDIGHVPFGHAGEGSLSKVCEENDIGKFHHNVQSVIFLDKVQKKNLTLQVLDGILCHDGESRYEPLKPNREKNWQTHSSEITLKTQNSKYDTPPMTLEGCVVRLADKMGYLGRDIKDALELKLINKEDLENELSEVCLDVIKNDSDDTKNIDQKKINRNIISKLVNDVIENSNNKDCISLSKQGSTILGEFIQFNYKNIYKNPRVDRDKDKIEYMYKLVFNSFLEDLNKNNKASKIFEHFLNKKDLKEENPEYLEETSNEEKVRDFIAGMTDDYFGDTFEELWNPIPKKIKYRIN